MKVDSGMYYRTAQLINLINHLDNGGPIKPTWMDSRKQLYYPVFDGTNKGTTWISEWERIRREKHVCGPEEFNLNFKDTNGQIDAYQDLVKVLIDTNVHGITGTQQVFATTLPPAPMRKSIRRRPVRNPEVLELYRQKTKKNFRSTYSSDENDDSDDDSNESLRYRRTISSEEDDYNRWEIIRRMLEISKILPEARVSELNFDKVSSGHDETYLRSYYMGENNGKQDNWNQDEGWDLLKNTMSLDNQDAEDKQSNNVDQLGNLGPEKKKKEKPKTGLDEPNVGRNKKYINKWGESKSRYWDNISSNNNDKKNRGQKNDENKKTSWSGKPLKSDLREKQDQDKKDEENERYKHKPNNDNLDKDFLNESKKAKTSDWAENSTTKKRINDYNKHPRNLDDKRPAPNKKDSWDSYGNKKIKEYDDNDYSRKKEKDTEKNKNNWDSPVKTGWDDYSPTKKNKKNLRSDTDKWDNIERSKKDSLGNQGSWERNTKNKEENKDSKRTKKDDWDKDFKKKSIWDYAPIGKDSEDEKASKKEKWNDKTIKKERWDDEKPKIDWNERSTKKGVWDDKSLRNDKSDDWDNKPKKKDSWDDKPVKKYWSDQREKTIKRWRQDKTNRDWNPPPTRKKKYDDYYERPRNKHNKRGRDMLNVRTPIPYRGKKGIYENV